MPGTKGRSGRRRKPDSLKVIQGTFQQCRSNPNQPKPKRGIPRPHIGLLSKDEKKYYKQLAKILDDMRILTAADVFILEILAQTLNDYYKARKELEKQPMIIEYEKRNGAPVVYKNPLISIMNEWRKTVISLLSRLGLDPSSRASLNIVPESEGEQDDPWQDI